MIRTRKAGQIRPSKKSDLAALAELPEDLKKAYGEALSTDFSSKKIDEKPLSPELKAFSLL